jgi:hypothetical protein
MVRSQKALAENQRTGGHGGPPLQLLLIGRPPTKVHGGLQLWGRPSVAARGCRSRRLTLFSPAHKFKLPVVVQKSSTDILPPFKGV